MQKTCKLSKQGEALKKHIKNTPGFNENMFQTKIYTARTIKELNLKDTYNEKRKTIDASIDNDNSSEKEEY